MIHTHTSIMECEQSVILIVIFSNGSANIIYSFITVFLMECFLYYIII